MCSSLPTCLQWPVVQPVGYCFSTSPHRTTMMIRLEHKGVLSTLHSCTWWYRETLDEKHMWNGTFDQLKGPPSWSQIIVLTGYPMRNEIKVSIGHFSTQPRLVFNSKLLILNRVSLLRVCSVSSKTSIHNIPSQVVQVCYPSSKEPPFLPFWMGPS